jgi:P27 family predicted phage terminase small subunit
VVALRRVGVLTQTHQAPLRRYCEATVLRATALEQVKKGMVYPLKDKAGNIIGMATNPYFKIALDLKKELTEFEDRTGLTPSSVTRVNAEPTAKSEAPKAAQLPMLRIAQ